MPQVAADGASSHPVMSADGRYVAFLSLATNLVAGDHAPQHWVNVYVHDTVLGTTMRMERRRRAARRLPRASTSATTGATSSSSRMRRTSRPATATRPATGSSPIWMPTATASEATSA